MFTGGGSLRYDINSHQKFVISFPKIRERAIAILFRGYILVSNWGDSKIYLYDLLIEDHSEIPFDENSDHSKSFFTDNVRAYISGYHEYLYESEENNPFKWNFIGNISLISGKSSFECNFSIYKGNIFASFLARQKMYCFMFNKKEKQMKLIYEEKVNPNF